MHLVLSQLGIILLRHYLLPNQVLNCPEDEWILHDLVLDVLLILFDLYLYVHPCWLTVHFLYLS